jgi:hypothetical protein
MEHSSLLGESKAFPNKVAYEKKIFFFIMFRAVNFFRKIKTKCGYADILLKLSFG